APAASLKHTTVYRDHRILGTTPRDIWSYIIEHPINDPDDGPAIANITHDHQLTFKTGTVDGVCKVSDLTFTWKFVITLPKLAEPAKISPATASMWKDFLAKVRWHEETRRKIFLECGNDFVPAAEKITGPAGCGGVERKVRNFVDAQYTLCMKKQRDFGNVDSPRVLETRLVKSAESGGAAR